MEGLLRVGQGQKEGVLYLLCVVDSWEGRSNSGWGTVQWLAAGPQSGRLQLQSGKVSCLPGRVSKRKRALWDWGEGCQKIVVGVTSMKRLLRSCVTGKKNAGGTPGTLETRPWGLEEKSKNLIVEKLKATRQGAEVYRRGTRRESPSA